jgi:hypothetical protein
MTSKVEVLYVALKQAEIAMQSAWYELESGKALCD